PGSWAPAAGRPGTRPRHPRSSPRAGGASPPAPRVSRALSYVDPPVLVADAQGAQGLVGEVALAVVAEPDQQVQADGPEHLERAGLVDQADQYLPLPAGQLAGGESLRLHAVSSGPGPGRGGSS